MAAETVINERGQGDAVWMLGGRYEVKASSEQTNGAMTMMEMWMPAGMGSPPHTHPGTESVYVLEGRVRYHIGGDTFDGGPGAFFHIPPDARELRADRGDAGPRRLHARRDRQVLRRGGRTGRRAGAATCA